MNTDTRRDGPERDAELTTAALAHADEQRGTEREFDRNVTEFDPETDEFRAVGTTTVERNAVPSETDRNPGGTRGSVIDGEYLGSPDDRSFAADRGTKAKNEASYSEAQSGVRTGAYGQTANSAAFNEGAIAGSFDRSMRGESFNPNVAQPNGNKAAVERSTGTADEDARTAPLLSPSETADFRARWDALQVSFVDEPRSAVEHADNLVANAMKRLAEVFADERARLEKQWDRGDDVSTEDLRLALRRYRSFFGRLLSV